MITNITSLTGNGLRDWLIQRVTAVILALYTVFLIGFLCLQPQLSYAVWHGLFEHTLMRVVSVLALLSLVLHAWVGVWTVTTDYLSCMALRLTCQMLAIVGLLACLVWGTAIVWGY